MKWIAKRDFYRTPELADVEITGGCKGATALVEHEEEGHALDGKKVSSLHANHIHKGAIFELGTSQNEAELQTKKGDPKRRLIAQLRYAGCISDASDKECVKRIEEDIAIDNKRNAEVEKRNKQTAGSDAIEKLTALIAKLTAEPATAK